MRRTVLANGLRVLTEAVPAVRSVSVGIWVDVGSRDETPELAGASHFLEHLLFKGTRRRTALEISAQIEAVGGETNAFTTKEYTCYFARVLDTDAALAVDVVCDLVTDSLLATADVEVERGVILEEIAMRDDEPSDEVHDLFAEALFETHPLGRAVCGTTETISAISPGQLAEFYRSRYAAPGMVVAAAGNLDHDEIVSAVDSAFRRIERFSGASVPAPRRSTGDQVPTRAGGLVIGEKDTEQAHLVLGGPGFCRDDDRRFALGVLNNVLGGGMSSRLFQQIRERRGLAYSVYSYTSHFADTGMFAVYAGCAPTKVADVLALTRNELATVADRGVTDAEVAAGKAMFRGALVLGMEDTGSRMSRLGKGELVYDRLYSVDELLRKIDEVTPDLVRQTAAEVLTGPFSLAVVGPFADHDFGVAIH